MFGVLGFIGEESGLVVVGLYRLEAPCRRSDREGIALDDWRNVAG